MGNSLKPRIGISTCLLGERVRYDGQHKQDRFICDTLGRYVEFVPVCPEVEAGLPVPREAMRLVGNPAKPRLMTINSGRDITPMMDQWIPKRLAQLKDDDLCGFIFKARSPSSGMERVKVYNGKGGLSGRAPGIFAKAFIEAFPLLPVEDEGRLHDPDLRENFIERIFALKRYRDFRYNDASLSGLVGFQSRNKLLIMAHSPKLNREMGRLVAESKRIGQQAFVEYETLLLEALRLKATVAKHCNVLQHMAGYFKKQLTPDEKQELNEVIESYRAEQIPLIVPVTLIKHHVRKHKIAYLNEQTYLQPHPLELKLRNHA